MEWGDPDLHTLQPTVRFSDRAEDYRRYRPDYPAAALDALLLDLPHPCRLVAVDVGAGTGISTRLLAERVARVLAVEPNAAMRAACAAHPSIEWREGTAEATGLAAESGDVVLCAQAFHWFRQREAVREFQRVLRPGGRLALMWNSRARSDPLTRGYTEAIHAVNGEHPAEVRPFDPSVLSQDGLFPTARLQVFSHHQTLDLTGLIGRALSASYVPKEGPAFERLRALLVALFGSQRDERGQVTMRYLTQLYLTEKVR